MSPAKKDYSNHNYPLERIETAKTAKEFPKECKQTRIDIDRRVVKNIKEWENQ